MLSSFILIKLYDYFYWLYVIFYNISREGFKLPLVSVMRGIAAYFFIL
jgi:hypothetical protein